MRWYLFLCTVSYVSLFALPVDLPTRAARQNQIQQDLPTVQALQVVNGFLQALADSNPSQAYYGYGSMGFRRNVPFADFKNFIHRFPPLYRNRSIQHDQEEYEKTSPDDIAVSGDVVTVQSLVESFDGQKNVVKFVLLYEAGQWRIYSIEMFPVPIKLMENQLSIVSEDRLPK